MFLSDHYVYRDHWTFHRRTKVIASAVRYNTTEFVYYGNYDDGPGIDKERYLLVAKLTAILRLANAMGI